RDHEVGAAAAEGQLEVVALHQRPGGGAPAAQRREREVETDREGAAGAADEARHAARTAADVEDQVAGPRRADRLAHHAALELLGEDLLLVEAEGGAVGGGARPLARGTRRGEAPAPSRTAPSVRRGSIPRSARTT